MTNVFSSKVTTWIGILIEVLAVIDRLFQENPVPQNKDEWVSFSLKVVTGAAFLFTKDWNKTHSQHANPNPHVAPIVPSDISDAAPEVPASVTPNTTIIK